MTDKEKIKAFLIEQAYNSDCELCHLMNWACPVKIDEGKVDSENWYDYEPDTSACKPYLEKQIIETLTTDK